MKKLWFILPLMLVFSGNIFAQHTDQKKDQKPKSGLQALMDNAGPQETAAATKLAFEKNMKSFDQMNNSGLSFFQDLAILEAATQLIKFKDETAIEYVAQIRDANLRHKGYVALPKETLNPKKTLSAAAVLKKKIVENGKESAYQAAYANLLYRSGQYKEALTYIKSANAEVLVKNADPQTYALILQKNKAYSAASLILEDIIKQGVADEELKQSLKDSWLALGKKEKDFPAHLESLYSHIRKEKETSLAGKLINYPAPDFSLTDLNGKTVSLAALKGKVVFIDFWATWCGPCVGSFPAMQKAVDKYKNHPDVVFLFINSSEKENDLEERRKALTTFIKDKGFRFQILLDNKQSGKYEVIAKYKVDGLPAKFVIDKSGNVRYALNGFAGATDDAFEEVSVLIENTLKF